MSRPTEAQIEVAIKSLRAMIDAVEKAPENSNQAGEDAVMAAAAGPELLDAAVPFVTFANVLQADYRAETPLVLIPEVVRVVGGGLTVGDLRALAAAAAKARGQ